MSAKSAKTFLTVFKGNSYDTFLKNLVYETVRFEVLNPSELSSEWAGVEFVKPSVPDNQELLQKADSILQSYQPKGFLNNFVDHRPEIVSKDIKYIEESRDKDKILNVVNLTQKYQNYNLVKTNLEEIVNNNPDKAFLIGPDVLTFKENLSDFSQYLIQIDSQNVHNYEIILFEKSRLEYVLDYKNSTHSQTVLYTHKQFLDFIAEEKKQIIQELKEFNFNPEQISKENYLLLCSIYGTLELDHILLESVSKIFRLSSNKEDSATTYAFISVHPDDLNKFNKVAENDKVVTQSTAWNKEIVVWSTSNSVTPFKNVAQSLGTIGTKETDPSLAITVFFSLFFAFCLGDALYGLILAVFCGYFIFFKNLKSQFQGIFQLFFISGVATVIFGALFNSWAGDLFVKTPLNPVFQSIQLIDPLNPLSKAPINQFLLEKGISPIVALLGFSAFIGFITLMVGYLIKILNTLKVKDYKTFAEETNWFVFIIFGILSLFARSLPSIASTIVLAVFAISGLSFFVTNGGKGIFGKTLGGLAKFYNLIGFGSDLLSFTRLIAVGLTGGIIATVINLLAFLIYESIPVPVLNILLTAVILLIGHLFNLVISLFGAYINPLRLHYVEFLPKFYEPSGQKLNFIKTDFKYLKLKN